MLISKLHVVLLTTVGVGLIMLVSANLTHVLSEHIMTILFVIAFEIGQ